MNEQATPSGRLEARYRRLLRAYPLPYRQERGEEYLDTLLASARADQHRPRPREAITLVVEGLRMRAGTHRPLPRTDLFLTGLYLMALLLLLSRVCAEATIEQLSVRSALRGEPVPPLTLVSEVLPAALFACAVIALVTRRTGWAASLVVVATTIQTAPTLGNAIAPRYFAAHVICTQFDALVAVSALLVLLRMRRRSAVPPRWTRGTVAVLAVLPTLGLIGDGSNYHGYVCGMAIAAGVSVVAVVIDTRVPIAIGLAGATALVPVALPATPTATVLATMGASWSTVLAASAVVPLILGAFGMRRPERV